MLEYREGNRLDPAVVAAGKRKGKRQSAKGKRSKGRKSEHSPRGHRVLEDSLQASQPLPFILLTFALCLLPFRFPATAFCLLAFWPQQAGPIAERLAAYH